MAFEDYEDNGNIFNSSVTDLDKDEATLRPVLWDEFYGQKTVKDNLKVYIEAARKRGDPLDHVLLYGPPGLGKTTLAGIIANELGVDFRITTGPAIEKPGDLAAILTNLNERDVLFIDEIHRMNRSVEEILYPAMEDYGLDIIIGKGPSARSIRLDIPKFTLIGATTRAGLLTGPLRDRFGVINRLDLYEPKDLKDILRRDAMILKIGIDEDALDLVSGRARGTPRIAIRILKRLRDFAQVKGSGVIDVHIAEIGLKALDIDMKGLDAIDRRIMRCMIDAYNGGPVGLETLAASTGEDPVTIEDIYEPYLMQCGFLTKTPRGRVLTRSAWEHLGIVYPESLNGNTGISNREQQMTMDDFNKDRKENE